MAATRRTGGGGTKWRASYASSFFFNDTATTEIYTLSLHDALPIDPRLGRMLLAAERHGCLREMLIIVSGLSIQDPRDRPVDQRDKADALHRRFWSQRSERLDHRASTATDHLPEPVDGVQEPSDFLTLLRLWEYLRESQKTMSGNGFRRLCRDEFLHFLRIREWQDLHTQLKEIAREL